MQPVAVYVHCPFCPSKCGYCDFSSFAMKGEIVERTAGAMIAEVLASRHPGIPAKSIFLGGGTPTSFTAEQLQSILAAVAEIHPPTSDCEITIEANPGTADARKFAAVREAGFNRMSLGAQSFNGQDLVRLGRVHGPLEIAAAFHTARRAGFENLNLDLMFALPGQRLEGWRENLRRALDLGPEHLSLYGLTIEPETRFYRLDRKGMLDLPNEEQQLEMYELALEMTAAAGYQQYEISNFALPGRECRHNLSYWRAEPYAGYGPGAVGCMPLGDAKARYTNLKHPLGYCEAVEEGRAVAFSVEELSDETLQFERVMLGLRLNEGLPRGLVAERQALDAQRRGWIDLEEGRLKLTDEGRRVCSEVTLALV